MTHVCAPGCTCHGPHPGISDAIDVIRTFTWKDWLGVLPPMALFAFFIPAIFGGS